MGILSYLMPLFLCHSVVIVTVAVATSHIPHRFSIQLLVDFDLARDWLDEELVLSVAADDGIQNVAVRLAVDVFRGHLGDRDKSPNYNVDLKDTKIRRTVCEFREWLP